VPKHAPRLPFAVIITALVVGGLALLLALNTAAAANELRRHALAIKDDAVAADVEQLRNEVAASAAPGNLATAAAELGMVPAANPAFLVDVHGRYVLRGKASPAPYPVIPAPATHHPKAHHSKADQSNGRHAKGNKKASTPKSSTTPKTSTTPTTTRSAKSTSTRSTGPASRHRRHPNATRSTPAAPPAPSPTPTPTPTVTLAGGPR
jgi:hypothetical protein